MLDIKFITESSDEVKTNLLKRKYDVSIIDQLLSLNETRKRLILAVENKRAEINKLSKEIGLLKKGKKDASHLMEQVTQIKDEMSIDDIQLEKAKEELQYLLTTIPNLASKDVPAGNREEENIILATWGKIREFDFPVKDHLDLGTDLGMLDMETAAKVTGSRFVISMGQLAQLERALINFMIDQHIANGYQEVIPPFIVNENSMYGTGQLPKFAEDSFKIEGRDWYLVPTAEVPLTNIKKNQLFGIDELPLKYVAYTPCFRSEAGSYGKDTKGLIRLHQFNKVELVNIVAPDLSELAHQEMVARATSILELLGLPYRQALLCGGEMGFSAQKCIDLEVWLPAQNKYREISSISNCGDFQARRAGIRFRDKDNRPQFAHTLNGSGLAVGRTLIAIMENYQQKDGSILIPDILSKYMSGAKKITKKR